MAQRAARWNRSFNSRHRSYHLLLADGDDPPDFRSPVVLATLGT
jgi:hypothetical protein